MGCVHAEFCVRMPCGHIEGEVKQDIVMLSRKDALQNRNPTLMEKDQSVGHRIQQSCGLGAVTDLQNVFKVSACKFS